jgi:outer membrane protein assembly factor BamB
VILLIGLFAAVAVLTQVGAVTQLTVKWAYNTSAAIPGKSFGAGHQSPPTVWDIDGDGINEIIWGTRRGDSKRLWCIKADGKTLKWIYPPIAEDGLPGDPTSKVSLVDVNNDGKYEIILGGRGGVLHCINPDGSVRWKWNNPQKSEMHGGAQALDVDADGKVDFFIQDAVGFIYRLTNDGQLVWTSFQCGKGNQGQTTICDIDRDGEYDVLWASQDFNVYCISAQTGSEKWRFNTGANLQTNQVIVADVNKDGEYEAIVWNDLCQVFCISFFGTEVWRWDNPKGLQGRICICQAMGDVDGDGSMDMAIMSDVGAYVIDIGGASPKTKPYSCNFTDMSLKGTIPAGATMAGFSSYQLIADIDGDNNQEILWLAPYPIVMDGKTGAIEAYYLNDNVMTGARQESGGWFGDVDKDGKSEWIVELNGKSHPQTMTYCLTLNGKFPADSPWPEYYHSAYPASYQNAQSWLTLKASASNSLWFPMPEVLLPAIAAMIGVALLRRK